MAKQRVRWRLFRRYLWSVLREAGWPAVGRDSLAALAAGVVAGGWGRAMTGDWSWLEPLAAGVVVGLAGYAVEIALAGYRLDAQKERELSALRGDLTEDEVRQANRDRKLLQRKAFTLLTQIHHPSVESVADPGPERGQAIWNLVGELLEIALRTDHARGEAYHDTVQQLADAMNRLQEGHFHAASDFRDAVAALGQMELQDREWVLKERRFIPPEDEPRSTAPFSLE